MAQLTRPAKEGGATTYQGKVAAGYTKILASEVDADLDKIYSAWNTGVDTDNIADGSITGAKLQSGAVGTRELADSGVQTVDIADGAVTQIKLAPGVNATGPATGDLAGNYPSPTVPQMAGGRLKAQGDANSSWLYIVARGQLTTTNGAALDLIANSPGMPDYVASESGYYVRLDYAGDTGMALYRRAPNTTAWVSLFTIGNDGGADTGKNRLLSYSGGLQLPAVWGIGASASNVVVGNTALWWDTGGMTNATPGQLVAPSFGNSVVLVRWNGHLQSPMGGLDVRIQFYDQPSATWKETWAGMTTGQGLSWLSCAVLWPAVPTQQFRAVMTNQNAVLVNFDAAQFSIACYGRRP